MTTATEITATEIHATAPPGWAVKNFKELKSMSEETRCFTATLHIDGKKVADVSNHGHGGPNMYRFTTRDGQALADAVARTLSDSKYSPLDEVVDEMVEQAEMLRQAKRDAKRGLPVTVFVKAGRTEAPRHESMGGGTFVYFNCQFSVALPTIDMLAEVLAAEKADEYQIISQ